MKRLQRTQGESSLSQKFRALEHRTYVERKTKTRRREQLGHGIRISRRGDRGVLVLRRVKQHSEIHANRTHGRGITQAETHGNTPIIQIGERLRFPRKRDVVNIVEYVSAIVKHRAAKPVADKWEFHREAQLLIKNQQRQPADRKPGRRIARAGLVQTEPPQRSPAAGEKSLGQRNRRA